MLNFYLTNICQSSFIVQLHEHILFRIVNFTPPRSTKGRIKYVYSFVHTARIYERRKGRTFNIYD
jgi:hypothetical protein